jgi:IS1 family transposase
LGSYKYRAYDKSTNNFIISHLKESCSIRGISRLAGISKNTVMRRIKKIADGIQLPYIIKGRSYEVDELKTYIGKKKREYWVVFALERNTKRIVSYCVGKRTTRNLGQVVNSLLLAEAKKIYTDKLNIYAGLIPKKLHKVKDFGTNHVERHHVNVRNNLKRLSRKTICYSKSLIMLSACIKVYLWG